MLELKDLTKTYGKFTAVDHLNLTIPEGDVFGFVGPNGAGKTTTMRMICGLLTATSGSIYFDGVDALQRPDDIKQMIGYVPDFFGVYDNLKVIEYMEFYASMYGISKREADRISKDLLDLVNLADKEQMYVDTLSRGMKQRLCVARALIHNPKLLILDEPNSGLDPRARYDMKEVLKHLGSLGKTIMISSHILPELSEMCSSIGIMEHGKLIASGQVDEIMESTFHAKPITMRAFLENATSQEEEKKQILQYLREDPDITNIKVQEDSYLLSFRGDERASALLLKRLISRGICISQFYQEKEDLESLFLTITGGQTDEKEA